MKQAYRMGVELHPLELAYTQSSYTKLGLFINSFELAIQQYREAYKHQSLSSGEYQTVLRRAKLYVSHFIQVVDLAILRGDLKPDTRAFYGLPAGESKLPSLAADSDVVEWGRKVIDGEYARTSQGNPPITNPTAALVRVHYETFFDAYNRQKIFQQNTSRCLTQLNELRDTADGIILTIWNEVESHFANLPAHVAREKAKGYGIVYVYRKNEINDSADGEGLLPREVAQTFDLFAENPQPSKPDAV